jgi:hypothetical protein
VGIPLSGVATWGEHPAQMGAGGFEDYAMSPRRKPTATAWALLRA